MFDLSKIAEKMKSKYKDEIILSIYEEDDVDLENLKLIPTDLIGIDYVLGVPGIPMHKITQIAGFEDSGKSLLMFTIIKQFQKYYKSGIPVLADTEYSFNERFFTNLGGDVKRIVVATPKTIEETFTFFEDVVGEIRKEYGYEPHILLCIDSLSVAVEDEIDKSSNQPGIHARILSRVFRKIRPLLPQWNATLIYISQNKEKIGTFYGGIARLGGHAVEFAPIMTLEIKRLKEEKDNTGETIGIHFRLKNTKNHISVPFRETELYFSLKSYRFVNGYNLVMLAQKLGIVKAGNKGWFQFNGKNYRFADLVKELESNSEIEWQIREKFNLVLDKKYLLGGENE